MLPDLAVNVNDIVFVVSPEMLIDIRPDERLVPLSATPASQQPALVYLAGLSKSSQGTMWCALRIVASILSKNECTPITLPWHLLRYQHVNAVRAKLIDHYKPRTGKKLLSALRGTLKEAWRLELMTAEDYYRAIDIKPIRGDDDNAAGRELRPGEIAALMAACLDDPGPTGPRDAAVLGLGVRCGLRRAEIVGLSLADLEGDQLTVFGKGRKTRTVYTPEGVNDALADWLHIRGSGDGPLFRAIQNGHVVGRGITPATVWTIARRRAKQAGIKSFSPHDLRRTFTGDLLEAGVDIATAQKILGHASASTTAKYDRRGERAKKDAAGRLHLPYQRRY